MTSHPAATAAQRRRRSGLMSRSSGQRHMSSVAAKTRGGRGTTAKYVPMDDCANEWTLAIIPERVRNVPKMVRKNVSEMRKTFHTLSIPRRSWIIIECTHALAVRNGMNAAFSTGSQPQ
jgi:hypothetical protein